ncbi:PLD nuclease N-terminal domain-containing protein [Streptomyces specialis]|uniref:PLD nuclease N-terminal domain-containing protein n=1 Tax=Streptomyces specialis TaxID=498367 RepID=UPI00073ED7BD|nr:PLD nuclease N-terminal domain-containing protein [Streptomyces specialis]
MLRVLLFLVPLALAIYALVDCISSRDEEIRHLPKLIWIFLIVLAWVVGPLAWIFVGRKRAVPGRGALGHRRSGGWVAPDDNPDFLRSLKETREEERRREEESRRNDGDEENPPGTT